MWLLLAVMAVVCCVCVWARSRREADPDARRMLRQLERRMHLLIAHCQRSQANDSRTERLVYRWDGRLLELTGRGAGSTSDKRQVSICLRDGDGQLQSLDVAVLVMIHEFAHLCSVTHGHTQEFWANFEWLLGQAEAAGLYTYVDYSKEPTTYCGALINHTPLRNRAAE